MFRCFIVLSILFSSSVFADNSPSAGMDLPIQFDKIGDHLEPEKNEPEPEKKPTNTLINEQPIITPPELLPTTFFGEEISTTNIAFLIDTSGSMSSENRLPKAKLELISSILGLDERVNFIVYSYTWLNGLQVRSPFSDLVPANPTNKQIAISWAATLIASGSTPTSLAVSFVVSHHDIDDLILLTDGRPNRPPGMSEQDHLTMIVSFCQQANTRCHCFGMGDYAWASFLRSIAQLTGGLYVSIP